MAGRSYAPHVLLALRELERSVSPPGLTAEERHEATHLQARARVLRLAVLRRATAGGTVASAAEALSCPARTVARWLADSPEADAR